MQFPIERREFPGVRVEFPIERREFPDVRVEFPAPCVLQYALWRVQ
jgi:hypothetical protein